MQTICIRSNIGYQIRVVKRKSVIGIIKSVNGKVKWFRTNQMPRNPHHGAVIVSEKGNNWDVEISIIYFVTVNVADPKYGLPSLLMPLTIKSNSEALSEV